MVEKNINISEGCSPEEEYAHECIQGSIEMDQLYRFISKVLQENNIEKGFRVTVELLNDSNAGPPPYPIQKDDDPEPELESFESDE